MVNVLYLLVLLFKVPAITNLDLSESHQYSYNTKQSWKLNGVLTNRYFLTPLLINLRVK
jgi:hypothetical protein